MEKAFTTPEQYPLTLKATTTGCNQKSNRDPVTSYSEGDVQQALDEMREDLLVAEVFTDGGRAARYRHYMRHKFDFTEAQFAIVAELLLRGRQQLGELRSRASRMVRIESQEQLREALQDLAGKRISAVQRSFGTARHRGRSQLLPAEREAGDANSTCLPSRPELPPSEESAEPQAVVQSVATAPDSGAMDQIQQLTDRIRDQAELISQLDSVVQSMDERLQRLERDLGV